MKGMLSIILIVVGLIGGTLGAVPTGLAGWLNGVGGSGHLTADVVLVVGVLLVIAGLLLRVAPARQTRVSVVPPQPEQLPATGTVAPSPGGPEGGPGQDAPPLGPLPPVQPVQTVQEEAGQEGATPAVPMPPPVEPTPAPGAAGVSEQPIGHEQEPFLPPQPAPSPSLPAPPPSPPREDRPATPPAEEPGSG
jgi:hypothetical protein